jgi:ketosteroid isomerase-like protein
MSEPAASTVAVLPTGFTGEEPYDVSRNDELVALMPDPVRAFYRAFLSGDVPGVLGVLDPAAVVHFPSYPPLVGIEAVAAYFAFQAGVFGELDFQLVDVLGEGAVTAVLWREKGLLADGTPWQSHGVDTLVWTASGIKHVEVGGPAWALRDVLPRFNQPILPPVRIGALS